MGVGADELGAFRTAVKELMRAGRIVRGGGECVMLPEAAGVIVGSFRGNARGFGFVVPASPTDHGDLFVPPDATLGAITGDTVAARITRRGRRGAAGSVEGEVIEIIERGRSRFVGELVRHAGQWMLAPDGHALHEAVRLGDVTATRARAGDQVVVELTRFPTPDKAGRGVIVEVLGKRGDPGVDTISIIRQYHFRDEFPDEVLADARRAVARYQVEDELERREDLRDQVVITIDPDEAKDFDDAISIRRRARGRVELGVHIADVSAFVSPGSPLDEEARLRGNSIYLPQHVIPMLPEALSNGLCSLQEDEPRLAKSVFIEYDARGNRVAKGYANTVIQSHKRLTYAQATAILEGKTRGFSNDVVTLVKEMERLAQRIRKRRLAAGMIVLDLADVELVLDDDGNVTDVQPEDTSFSHTIIEMFMVEANEAVAELLTDIDVPHLRRIHPEPPSDARTKLGRFLRVLGRPIPRQLEREDMIRLLDSVRGTPEAFAVNLAVLRSMARAEYSPKRIGHFALASQHYSHFTSPIRRYPDLLVHRLLQMYLDRRLRKPRDRASAPSAETLREIGNRCTYTEQQAEAAERELKLIKILRYLEQHLGDEEDGIVTGVTNVGVFVQLARFQVDGLIRFADLADDWWEIDARGGCAVGQRSRRRIAIGDRVRVQIAGVDLAARELDLALIETPARSRSGKKSASRSGSAAAKAKPRRTASRSKRAGPRSKSDTRRPSRGRRPRRR